MTKGCRALIAVASLAVAPSIATAQNVEGQFAVRWLPTWEPSATSLRVRTGQTFYKARMLPTRLLITDADVFDGKGRLILPRDSELAYAQAPFMMACVIDARKIKKAQGRKFVANSFNTCLIDLDRDGKFERRSEYASRYWSMGAAGKVLSVRPVVPTPYREANPETSKDYFTLHLVLLRNAASSGEMTFGLCLKEEPKASDCLTEMPKADTSALPHAIDVMGARLLIEKQDKDGAQIVVERQFARVPVTIQAKWF